MVTALESAQFSELVYNNDNAPPVPEGWGSEPIKTSPPNNNGMYSEAYQNPSTGEVLVVYRGTEPSDVKDLITDGQIIHAGLTDIQTMQDADAVKFLQDVINETGATDIHVTGHSLGDHLAQEALIQTANNPDFPGVEYSGIGFNGPDVNPATDLANVNYSHIDTRGDLVSRFGDDGIEGNDITLNTGPGAMHYGMDVVLGFVLGPVVGVGLAANHALDAHSMTLIREYLEAHPNVGIMPSNAVLTAEQILEIRDNPEGFVYFNDSSVDNEGSGEGEYNPDSIVRFDDDGNPVTAAEAGLVSDPDAPINQLGSGPGGSAGINPTWGGNDLNHDGIVSDAEILNLQRSAIENGLRGVNDFYNAMGGDDWLGAVDSGLDVAMAIDRYLDTGTDALGGGSEGFISEGMENRLDAVNAGFGFYNALENGSTVSQIGSGMNLAQNLTLFISWNAPRNEPKKRTLSRRATRSLRFSAKTGAAELASLRQSSRLSVLACDAWRREPEISNSNLLR